MKLHVQCSIDFDLLRLEIQTNTDPKSGTRSHLPRGLHDPGLPEHILCVFDLDRRYGPPANDIGIALSTLDGMPQGLELGLLLERALAFLGQDPLDALETDVWLAGPLDDGVAEPLEIPEADIEAARGAVQALAGLVVVVVVLVVVGRRQRPDRVEAHRCLRRDLAALLPRAQSVVQQVLDRVDRFNHILRRHRLCVLGR